MNEQADFENGVNVSVSCCNNRTQEPYPNFLLSSEDDTSNTADDDENARNVLRKR
jgi:hypothetical protein